jgi:anti-sigma B factor antagonist
MNIVVEREGDVAVVTIPVEELDAGNSGELKRELSPMLREAEDAVFDLSPVRFIDSSGLGTMLSCLRQLSARGGDLKLCGLSKQVRATFELVRLDRIFEI